LIQAASIDIPGGVSLVPATDGRNQGKPFKVVMVACIRKLFTILNAMLKRGTK